MADQVNQMTQNITPKFRDVKKEIQKKKSWKKKKKPRKPVVKVNTRKDQRIITEYHALNKKIDSVIKNRTLSDGEKALKIAELEAKQEKLGGIDAYQKASKLGESRHGNFNSAQWVVKHLKTFNVRANRSEGEKNSETTKLKLLDVGALDNNYEKYRKWIQCTPIDINPQSSKVLKADFLKQDCKVNYDVVVLSLVINFEGDVKKRGDMLRKCNELVVERGFLFIVLPLPCLTNSRYFSERLFISMLETLGFEIRASHNSKKLSFFMFSKTRKMQTKSFPKRPLRKGGNHNNFAIVL